MAVPPEFSTAARGARPGREVPRPAGAGRDGGVDPARPSRSPSAAGGAQACRNCNRAAENHPLSRESCRTAWIRCADPARGGVSGVPPGSRRPEPPPGREPIPTHAGNRGWPRLHQRRGPEDGRRRSGCLARQASARVLRGRRAIAGRQALPHAAAYNAGPGRVATLRRRAERPGLDPNHWFGNVETVALKDHWAMRRCATSTTSAANLA